MTFPRALGRFGLDAGEVEHLRALSLPHCGGRDPNLRIIKARTPASITFDGDRQSEFVESLGRWLADVAGNGEQRP